MIWGYPPFWKNLKMENGPPNIRMNLRRKIGDVEDLAGLGN